MKYLCVAVFLLLLLTGTAFAERTVWYVHPDSTLNSIQAALDSCVDYDIVLVAPGTYVENITWPDMQGIQLLSVSGSENTILDGDSLGRVIAITSGVDSTTIVRGFTIQNGYIAGFGGGIYCFNSSPTIMDNIIYGNSVFGVALGGGELPVETGLHQQ